MNHQHKVEQAALNDAMELIASLELPYLEALEKRLAEHITKRRAAQRLDAIAAIQRIAASVGMSVDDLVTGAPRQLRVGPGTPRPPRYRDPVSGKTWTGAGMPPRWIRDHEDREQFRIAA